MFANTKLDGLYVGLAGTGKSTKLAEDAVTAIKAGKKVLHISLTEDTRQEIIKKFPLLSDYAHTIQSIIYPDFHEVACSLNLYEVVGWNYFDESFSYEELFLNIPYRRIGDLQPCWNNFELKSFKDLDSIYIDDIQNFTSDMKYILEILFSMNKDAERFAVGAPYECVIPYLNLFIIDKGFDSFERMLEPKSVTFLSSNYRSSPSIQLFLNGSYEELLSDNKFYNLDHYKPEEYADDVFIHSVKSIEDENKVVEKILNLYPDKNITIFDKDGQPLVELYKHTSDRVKISSIYNDNRECDVVIVIETWEDELSSDYDIDLKNNAMSRAREKIHLVSRFPQETVTSRFKEGTYTLIDECN